MGEALMRLDIFYFYQNIREKFEAFSLSAVFGLILFKLYFIYWPVAGKNEIMNFYPFAWLIFPLLGFLETYGIEIIRRGLRTPPQRLYPILLFLNFNFMLYLLHPAFWGKGSGNMLVGICLCLQGLGFFKFWKPFSKHLYWVRFSMLLSACVWFITLTHPWVNISQWSIFDSLIFLGLLFSFYSVTSPETPKPLIPWDSFPKLKNYLKVFVYLAVLVSIFFVIVDPKIVPDIGGMTFSLGPLADLRGGKSLLFNINAQYGVFFFYFLNLFFYVFPLGFQSLNFVVILLTVAQYFILYFIAKQLFKKESAALFCLAVVIVINFFIRTVYCDPTFPYSGGPLRFGFIYILMALALLRPKFPGFQNRFYLLEAATAATAFFWSFDVCVFTVPAYCAYLVVESIRTSKHLRFNGRLFSKRFAFFLGVLAFVGLFIYLDIFRRVHCFPHWSYYFDFIQLYKNGFGSEPTPLVGYWWIIIGIYYFSFFCITALLLGHDNTKTQPENLSVIALLTFYGITQFTYYLGESHWDYQLLISMPSAVLFIYWLFYLRMNNPHAIPSVIKKGFFITASLFFALFFSQPLMRVMAYVQQRALPISQVFQAVKDASMDLPREHSFVFAQAADELMNKYSPGQKSLVYFFGPGGLALSVYTGRINIYPYNDSAQASISPPILARIQAFNPALKIGDCVYLTPLSNPLFGTTQLFGTPEFESAFEKDLWEKLQKLYLLELVETKNDISVYRVVKKF